MMTNRRQLTQEQAEAEVAASAGCAPAADSRMEPLKVTNKKILRAAKGFGMVILRGGYRRGGYIDTPGMWLFEVEFNERPEGWLDRCDGVVEAYDVADALGCMKKIHDDWKS